MSCWGQESTSSMHCLYKVPITIRLCVLCQVCGYNFVKKLLVMWNDGFCNSQVDLVSHFNERNIFTLKRILFAVSQHFVSMYSFSYWTHIYIKYHERNLNKPKEGTNFYIDMCIFYNVPNLQSYLTVNRMRKNYVILLISS